jgi:hypothetical protein
VKSWGTPFGNCCLYLCALVHKFILTTPFSLSGWPLDLQGRGTIRPGLTRSKDCILLIKVSKDFLRNSVCFLIRQKSHKGKALGLTLWEQTSQSIVPPWQMQNRCLR